MTPVDVFWDRCEGPIQFGANDCCLTIADVLVAAGGPDLMARYRGRYKTSRGFVRALRRAGYKTMREACEATLKACGLRVYEPADFDVTVVEHFDLTTAQTVHSPAVFIDGAWLFRTERAGAAILPNAFQLQPEIFRILGASRCVS